MITVCIAVGPKPAYRKYFQECLDSLKVQTVMPTEVLIVDDMARLEEWEGLDFGDLPISLYKNAWLSGPVWSYNFGIVMAKNGLIMMLGSDDKLHPWAVADCLRAWEQHQDPIGYYWCDVEYSTGEFQSCPSGPAMVTKQLWLNSGGFPPPSAVGAADSTFISILLSHTEAGHLIKVESEKPPWWYRVHDETMSAEWGSFQPAIFNVRSELSIHWKHPDWAKDWKRPNICHVNRKGEARWEDDE